MSGFDNQAESSYDKATTKAYFFKPDASVVLAWRASSAEHKEVSKHALTLQERRSPLWSDNS